jgi:endonuclease YncB( thermonuclease family)
VIYRVLNVPYVVDGDTAWVQREWSQGDIEGVELIARDYAGGSKVRLDDGGKGLNTPEKKQEGWAEARQDLLNWLEVHRQSGHQLELHTRGKKDSFGRILGDFVVIGVEGALTAVEYMIVCGWEPYK